MTQTMTALELFQTQYQLPVTLHGNPFQLHPLQVETINELGCIDISGLYLDVGTGKTVVETVISLSRKVRHQADACIVIMPPLLVRQWAKWLTNIKHLDGSPLRVTEYRGSPAQRAKLSLDADFILVGIQIFKRDYSRFVEHFTGKYYTVSVDEANMLCNVNTDTHQKVHEFSRGVPVSVMTGTPANNPLDAYGLIKFTSPTSYKSYNQFYNIHVEEEDFFGKPSKFRHLDTLQYHLIWNSKRVLFEDMYPDTETPLFVPQPYDLEPEHLKLYHRLAEEQLLALPDGAKIDATTSSKLIHALGQIVVNWGHFAGDPKKISNAVGMVAERLDEVDKLVVFANYRSSIQLLTESFAHAGAVAINGDVSPAQKQAAITSFTTDPKCRVIFIHPKSGGAGLDGLQHVCHHMMFVEPTQSPRDFTQCVARLKRTGQRKRVVVSLPTAEGTLQVRAFANLIRNDDLVNTIVRNAFDLRSAIFGK